MNKKIEIYAKLFTSMFSDKVLHVAEMDPKTLQCKDPWNWFGMEFKTKKMKDEFLELVKDIDQNPRAGFTDLNVVKITFENAFDDKWRKDWAKQDKISKKKEQKFLDESNKERFQLEIEDEKILLEKRKKAVKCTEDEIKRKEKYLKELVKK